MKISFSEQFIDKSFILGSREASTEPWRAQKAV